MCSMSLPCLYASESKGWKCLRVGLLGIAGWAPRGEAANDYADAGHAYTSAPTRFSTILRVAPPLSMRT
jgi:hypothetical protein